MATSSQNDSCRHWYEEGRYEETPDFAFRHNMFIDFLGRKKWREICFRKLTGRYDRR